MTVRLHPANIPRPRPQPFMVIRKSVDNRLTYRKTPLWFASVRLTALPKLGPKSETATTRPDTNSARVVGLLVREVALLLVEKSSARGVGTGCTKTSDEVYGFDRNGARNGLKSAVGASIL